MPLTSGSRLGPYEIVAPIGAGGMGEVYRARDTRLERTVAVKVLATHLSASPEVRQRFDREAKTISQLSHPHICALYDVGHQDGTDYLVMEYLEGETLSDRLGKGALSVEQTLRFGTEIADALDKAHRQGIVHRDLKPGNVMLTKSGVKLLDFGLAKAMTPSGAANSLTALPTQANLTQEGTILGTFQYMAPEQLEGKDADARTDIFAFGCVLYEMATGRKAFSGASRASLISSIMKEDPSPVSQVQPMSPAALDRIVKTCLEKDPEERWQSAADIKRELRWIAEGGSQAGPAPTAVTRKSRERLLWIALAILALAAALPWVIRDRKAVPVDVAVTRFAVLPPDDASFLGGDLDPVTISPDGRRFALLATSEGRRRIWIRLLESLTPEQLPGTEGASYPFWSPDSQSIGFFADGKLKKIAASGGPVQTLCDAPIGRGGSWSRDGVILFAPRQFGEPLYRVSSSGGVPVPATRLEPSRKESAHRWPSFLPDGRHFLYLASVSTRHANNGIYVGSLDSKETTLLIRADSNVAYSPAGHILFVRDHTLMAQRFDAERLRPVGEMVLVVERMPQDIASSHSPFSVSGNGTLAYWTGDTKKELVWFDQAGKRLASLVGASDLELAPSLSPDEKRVALSRPDARSGRTDIWVVEISRGISSRLTLDRFGENFPIWSPDGTRIAYTSNRDGPEDVYVRGSTGTGREELLNKSDVAHKHPLDWSRDGRFILYHTQQPRTGSDVLALPLFGNRQPIPFLSTEFEERHAQFSPDGRHVVYASDESGVYEIYVQPFPGPGEKLQVSTQGGIQPRWRRDGKEIFYVARDARMMAAPLSASAGTLSAGNPRALFQTPILPDAIGASLEYVVTADGQRFLIATPASETLVFPATVVLNWAAKLER